MIGKCSIIVISSGAGGLSVKQPCSRLAVHKIGKRNFCSEHLAIERERLHLNSLEQGARILVKRTANGTRCILDPLRRSVDPAVFRELVALGRIEPEDPMFPDTWRLTKETR